MIKQAFHVLLLLFFVISIVGTPAAAESQTPFSIAFYYAQNPPLNELKAFDIAVVDPGAVSTSPRSYANGKSELFAYISLGEANPASAYFTQIKPNWLIGENSAWKSRLVDLSNPDWRSFFLDQVVEPLWQAGYRGFFLDTLDSYQLLPDKKLHQGMQDGLVQLIRDIKKRHPEARLILNRGFELLDRVKDVTFAVAAESLYQNFDPATGKYGDVKENDRQWLTGKFSEVQKAGIAVIAIDYVAPGNRDLARETAKKIKAMGYIPWVTDKDLAALGVGAVEVQPRTILGLYDGTEGPDPIYTNLLRFAVMPLNYLGYQVELHDLRNPLPQGILRGRYAGVVVWPNSSTSGRKNGLLEWVRQQMADGVKIVFLDQFGFPYPQLDKSMSVSLRQITRVKKVPTLLTSSPLIGFEMTPLPRMDNLVPLRVDQGEALLSLGNERETLSDAVAITPWGGYALEPFVLNKIVGEFGRWVINPFEFFKKALRLETAPALDTTTENGVRLLLSHIDADGFESRVERPAGPIAAAEFRDTILKKYRIPTTFSVITSTLGDHDVNQGQAAELQSVAREIFALPLVEAASHTFSHPFYWKETEITKQDYTSQYLPIPGYKFSLEDEITGSIRFIEQQLLPPSKKVRLLQWTGNCVPDAEALAVAYRNGVANINGGDTKISESNRSVTAVSPLGISRGGYFQIFAPNQNENVYTNDWTGPFYGYRRVLETFRLTDSPRRLKPINIYYHLYSVTKEASRRALEDVYTSVLEQKPFAIHTSEYTAKVLDFNQSVLARLGDGWLIRTRGDIRQLRLPISAGYPDLTSSKGVMGFSDHNDQRYIHLAPGGESTLKLTDSLPARAWLSAAAARIEHFEWTASGMRLTVSAYSDGYLRFGGADGCRLFSKNRQIAMNRDALDWSTQLTSGSHELELVCK